MCWMIFLQKIIINYQWFVMSDEFGHGRAWVLWRGRRSGQWRPGKVGSLLPWLHVHPGHTWIWLRDQIRVWDFQSENQRWCTGPHCSWLASFFLFSALPMQLILSIASRLIFRFVCPPKKGAFIPVIFPARSGYGGPWECRRRCRSRFDLVFRIPLNLNSFWTFRLKSFVFD